MKFTEPAPTHAVKYTEHRVAHAVKFTEAKRSQTPTRMQELSELSEHERQRLVDALFTRRASALTARPAAGRPASAAIQLRAYRVAKVTQNPKPAGPTLVRAQSMNAMWVRRCADEVW